jgi:hypothetical protein
MFTVLTFCLALFTACSTAKVTPNPPVLQVTPPLDMQMVEGKLINQVGRLENAMPRASSEGFVVPTDAEKNFFSNIVTSMRSNDLGTAMTDANSNGYELLWYTDLNDDNAVSYVLREVVPSKRGWGLYVFRAATNSHVIIEAPHPLFDEGTPALSVKIYRALEARALLIAGAHRDANRDGSADVSHDPQSIFQAIHDEELKQSIALTGSAIILQIHGFSAAKHPAYPHVIISYEHGKDINPIDLVKGQQLASGMAKKLNDKGIKTSTCGTGEWRDLCGGFNVQASQLTRGIFIHIELDETVRSDDAKFIEALMTALGN